MLAHENQYLPVTLDIRDFIKVFAGFKWDQRIHLVRNYFSGSKVFISQLFIAVN